MNENLTIAALDDLVKEYAARREAYDAAKLISNAREKERFEAETKLLAALKVAKKKTYAVDGIGAVSHVSRLAVRTPSDPARKKLFFEYLQKRGEDVFLSLATVNYNSLNSFFAAEAEAAQANNVFPFSIPGIEEPTENESLSFRKAK